MLKIKKENIVFYIFAIFLICIFCFSISPVELQNDTFYTIKVGEQICKNGIDMIDHFSWHDNLPYTYPHWLYDIMIFKIFSNFGFVGIYISTVIFSCILGVCVFFTNNKISKNKMISLIISLISMFLIKDYIAARAQLVTFILFTLELFFIESFIEKHKKRYLIYLLIIPCLIANLHAAVWPFYFVLFIPYIAEYLVFYILQIDFINILKTIIKKIKKKIVKHNDNKEKIQKEIEILKIKKQEKIKIRNKKLESSYKIILKKNKYIKWIIAISIIAIITGLFTPIGDTPYSYLIKTIQGNTTQNINEHLPLILIQDKNILIVLTLYISILILSSCKIKLRDFCMLFGLILLSFISKRQTSMFILITGPILTKLIVNIIENNNFKFYAFINKHINKYYGKILVISLVMLCCFFNLKSKKDEKFINEQDYPVQCSDYILENFEVNNMKIYNEYNYGSYLIFKELPVFIDSRVDLYAPEFNGNKNEKGEFEGRDIFSDFLDISSIAAFYEDKFNDYEITDVLTYRNSKLNMLLERDENYELLYKDDWFIFYKRLNSQNLSI